jgi:hypothetical protein
MTNKPKHGGARKGAGRKPLPDDQKKVKMTIAFSPEIAEILRRNRPIPGFIEKAIKEHLKMQINHK